jgi:hypothetical protein
MPDPLARRESERFPGVADVQVGAADRCECHFDDGVSGLLDCWIINGIDPNIAVTMEGQCAHMNGLVVGGTLAE